MLAAVSGHWVWRDLMPVEFALWRMDGTPKRVEATILPSEAQLEDLLASDISILGLDLMLVGRQVMTAYGKKIDLLAMDRDGSLYVIELKRDKTPREVVAQALDYGSWAMTLTYAEIASIHLQTVGKPL
jgi:RecB family endonuclease NucS